MPENITQQLYAAVSTAMQQGWSINRIAQSAQISRPSLQDWYSGARQSLSLETAAGLASWLGMRLTAAKIPKSGQPSNRKPKAKSAKPKRKNSAKKNPSPPN